MSRKIWVYVLACALMSCSSMKSNSDCISSSLNNLHQVLVSQVGREVCITGKIVLEPHFTYFETVYTLESNLYGGKVYIPYKYSEAKRAGLKSGQQYEYRGILNISYTSDNCESGHCSLYFLKKK